MTSFDLIALALVGAFALWGLFSGFSRQVAAAAAAVVAFAGAGPGGRFLAEPVARGLKASLTVGTVAATILVFVVLWIAVRLLLTAFLRGLLAGKDGNRRGLDRALGFGLGGLKAGTVIFVGVCAALFLENNLVIAGHRFSFTPKDSRLVQWARQANVLEYLQFGGVRDLMKAAKLSSDPQALGRLKGDPDYAALMADPRFRQVINQDALRRALQMGDVQGLLKSNGVVELINDPKMARHLERLGDRAE
jgi:membrane protein required for colicin V production